MQADAGAATAGFSGESALRPDDRPSGPRAGTRQHRADAVAAEPGGATGGAGTTAAGVSFPSSLLAPNAKLRALVVPQEPEPPAPGAPPVECEASCSHHRPVRLSWAKLLKRVFEIDIEHGPNCGGGLKIIAAILEQPVIEKILTPLALQARAPPRAPARGSQLQAA